MKMPPTLLADRKAPIKERQVACLFRLKRNVSQNLPYILYILVHLCVGDSKDYFGRHTNDQPYFERITD